MVSCARECGRPLPADHVSQRWVWLPSLDAAVCPGCLTPKEDADADYRAALRLGRQLLDQADQSDNEHEREQLRRSAVEVARASKLLWARKVSRSGDPRVQYPPDEGANQ